MGYDILKGWPSDAAIDMTFAATGDVEPGMGVTLQADGTVAAGTYATAGTDNAESPYFVLGKCTVKGTFVCANHAMVIELVNVAGETPLFTVASYTPNQEMSLTAGRFVAAVTDARPVATVISYNAGAGKLVLRWLGV